MKVLKIVLSLLLCGVIVLGVSCAAKSDATQTTQSQVVTVQRGDLTVDITGSGNLALSHMEELAFQIPATFQKVMTVAEVLVEEGDSVEEGQALARLDTLAWQDELTTLESTLATAKRNEIQAEINLQNAETSLEDAEKEYTTSDEITAAATAVSSAARTLAYDKEQLEKVVLPSEIQRWTDEVNSAQQRLTAAQANLEAVKAGPDPKEVTLAKLQLEMMQGRLEDAQAAVEKAQKNLDEAESLSPEIIATFNGFVTSVNVAGGDEVYKGTVAVTIADPDKFEAEIMVNEMDIFNVILGGAASVEVTAMPTINLSANVTHISPTATIQSGVVNYVVKVEIQSPQAVSSNQSVWSQIPSFSGGQLPFVSGNQSTENRTFPSMSGTPTLPTLMQAVQLKEGLSVTVSIIVDQKNDVLMVPSRAITRRGRQASVQVMNNGVAESRSITTGLTNGQYTEVTDGLSEGEQVVIAQTTGTTTSTTSTQRQGQFFIGPGLGR